MHTTLISPKDLAAHGSNSDWVIVDCRFDLADPQRGWRAYQQSHIPQSLYAHLDDDLSGAVIPQKTGRHPLPAPEDLAQTFSRWGIDSQRQVVAYDDAGGAIAARLWWMLRWLGHDAVAVLDGGWPHWLAENLPTSQAIADPAPRSFVPKLRNHLLVNAHEVLMALEDPTYGICDARSADRFRGENATIDPIAGHIAHARSAPFAENLGSDGRFLPQEALRQRFRSLLGTLETRHMINYCGSGVTACHNLLALLHAGLGDGLLYAGSWSEWITDENRPRE